MIHRLAPTSVKTGKARRRDFTPTERDIEIIRYVHSYRLLRSRSHLVELFGGSLHILRRLQKLAHYKYLNPLPRRPHEETVYAIGNAGADLLSRRFGEPRPKVDWTAQNRSLTEKYAEHTLLISDVMISIEIACREREGVRFISPEEILSEYAPQTTRQEARRVGGKPFLWSVPIVYKGWRGEKSIEPDRMFGIAFEDSNKDTEWFFLEADRGTMVVKPQTAHLHKSSIFKKQIQYWASAVPAPKENLYTKHFGIRDIRTLFVLATGARGDLRLNKCIEANKHFSNGQGTGLFLFTKIETLLEAPDILEARLISGRGEIRNLIG